MSLFPDSAHGRALRRLGLVCLLQMAAVPVIWAAATPAPDKAPWLLTPEERAASKALSDEARRDRRERNPGEFKPAPPSAETLARMHRELADLQAQVDTLPKDANGLPPVDAALYTEAVALQLRINEWPDPFFERATLTCLGWGRAVVAGLKADPNFMRSARLVVPMGFRSSADRSVQPYLLMLPRDFDPQAPGPYRLIVSLHGAGPSPSKVGSIAAAANREGDIRAGAITINAFCRGNGWYQWTAEADVWDAIADVKRRYPIDENQIVLTGFSMGGGGAAKLGLTHPGAFASCGALGPALFALDPMPKAADLPEGPRRWAPLTDEEIGRRLTQIYAAPALGENGLGMPWLLGCGGDDRLIRVQDALRKAFDSAGVAYTTYALPGVGHNGSLLAAQPEYQRFIRDYVRDPAPREVVFATGTLRSASRAWVTIEGLTAHYAKGSIRAVANPEKGTLTVTTEGVGRFSLNPPPQLAVPGRTTVSVDGTKFAAAGANPAFEKVDGKWQPAAGPAPALAKRPGLQGPVADAFTRPFLCVRPTGEPWNLPANRHALAMLEQLQVMWRTQLYAELPLKDDRDVTAEDRARYDLVLFGDPGSNRLIAETLAAKSPWALPLRWDKTTVGLGAEAFAADSHLPALIYPDPLQAGHYVVINGAPLDHGGGPNRDPDADKQIPVLPKLLGDFAILRIDPAEGGRTVVKPVYGGFFNEQWQ